MHRVIRTFCDLQDENHVYQTGDTYPRKGQAVKKRCEEINSTSNGFFLEEIKTDKGVDEDGRINNIKSSKGKVGNKHNN